MFDVLGSVVQGAGNLAAGVAGAVVNSAPAQQLYASATAAGGAAVNSYVADKISSAIGVTRPMGGIPTGAPPIQQQLQSDGQKKGVLDPGAAGGGRPAWLMPAIGVGVALVAVVMVWRGLK